MSFLATLLRELPITDRPIALGTRYAAGGYRWRFSYVDLLSSIRKRHQEL